MRFDHSLAGPLYGTIDGIADGAAVTMYGNVVRIINETLRFAKF